MASASADLPQWKTMVKLPPYLVAWSLGLRDLELQDLH